MHHYWKRGMNRNCRGQKRKLLRRCALTWATWACVIRGLKALANLEDGSTASWHRYGS